MNDCKGMHTLMEEDSMTIKEILKDAYRDRSKSEHMPVSCGGLMSTLFKEDVTEEGELEKGV